MSWVKKLFTDFQTVIDAAFLNGIQDQIIADETDLANKVDKVTGKGLSTQDFTTALKNKLQALPMAETLDTELDAKVDKVEGKGLSTNDLTNARATKLDSLPSNVVDAYSTLETYSVGDYRLFNDKLYRCISAIETAEEWNADHWEEAKLTEEIEHLFDELGDETTGLDSKAPVILETASGAIASFSDGADSMPVKKLVANIEPVQDLHGYANPWPAGGGKNLLPIQSATQTINGVTFTVQTDAAGNKVGITAAGTATANIYYQLVAFENSAEVLASLKGKSLLATGITGGSQSTYRLRGQYKIGATNYDVFNLYSGYASASFPDDAEQMSIQIMVLSGATINETLYPMIRLSTETDPTFAPYSNICPISGWTGAEVKRTGKNLLQNAYAVTETRNGVTITSYNDGSFMLDGTATATFLLIGNMQDGNRSPVKTAVKNLPNGNFISSNGGNFAGRLGIQVRCHDMTNEIVISTVNITINDDYPYNYVSIIVNNGAVFSNEIVYPMIRLASDADPTFAPYSGQSLSVTFPSSAGTVYGGTLTVNPDRTGTLVVDRKTVDLGSLNWSRLTTNVEGKYRFSSTNIYTEVLKPATLQTVANILCSEFKPIAGDQPIQNVNGIAIHTNGGILVYDDASATLTPEEFKTRVQGVQLCYELATPITYTLTASEISAILTTLYGTNNVWSDVGDTEVTYPADTKLYVDNKVTQAIANALNA